MTTRQVVLLLVPALAGFVVSATGMFPRVHSESELYVTSSCEAPSQTTPGPDRVSAIIDRAIGNYRIFSAANRISRPFVGVGAIWSTVILTILIGALLRANFRADASALLFVTSVPALGVILNLWYDSNLAVTIQCGPCFLISGCVTVIFFIAALVQSGPMSHAIRRLPRSVRELAGVPTVIGVGLVLSMLAVLVRLSTTRPASEGAGTFEQWYSAQPRSVVPIEGGSGKVVIVKFNDYQCPPCKKTYHEYHALLYKHLKANPGLILYVTKDFPLDPACNNVSRAASVRVGCEAAVAARIAQATGNGAAMEAWLFNHQSELSVPKIRQMARLISGVRDYEAAYEGALKLVSADIALGRQLAIRSTPTFFINGRRLGAVPPDLFDAAIQQELRFLRER